MSSHARITLLSMQKSSSSFSSAEQTQWMWLGNRLMKNPSVQLRSGLKSSKSLDPPPGIHIWSTVRSPDTVYSSCRRVADVFDMRSKMRRLSRDPMCFFIYQSAPDGATAVNYWTVLLQYSLAVDLVYSESVGWGCSFIFELRARLVENLKK